MTFSEALEAMKAGKVVRLQSYPDEIIWIQGGTFVFTGPHTKDRTEVDWTNEDILADNWEIVE